VTEKILELGAELGSLTLLGRRTGEDWKFAVATVDQSELLLDDDAEEIRHTGPWVDGWTAALRELDKRAWFRLYPLSVRDGFATRILQAVRERLGDSSDDEFALARWERIHIE